MPAGKDLSKYKDAVMLKYWRPIGPFFVMINNSIDFL